MTLPLTAHLITNKSFVVKIGDFFVDNYLTINERVLGWQEVNKFHFFVRKSISESERRYKKNRWLFASHRIDVPEWLCLSISERIWPSLICVNKSIHCVLKTNSSVASVS